MYTGQSLVPMLLLLLLTPPATAGPRPVQLESPVTDAQLAGLLPLLEKGEVSLLRSKEDGRLAQVTVIGLVRADRQHIWTALTDYSHYEQFMPNLEEARITKRQGRDVVIHYELEVPGVNLEYTLRHRHHPTERIDIWLEDAEGDIQTGAWRWELKPLPDRRGCLLLYHLYTDVKESSWLLEQAMESQPAMEHGLNVATGLVTLRAVKKRAEAKP